MISPYVYAGIKIDTRPLAKHTAKQTIIQAVCNYYGVPEEKLYEVTRKTGIVLARQMVYKLMRDKISGVTQKEIAESFNQDRTTVLHGLIAIQNRIDTDKAILQDYKTLSIII